MITTIINNDDSSSRKQKLVSRTKLMLVPLHIEWSGKRDENSERTKIAVEKEWRKWRTNLWLI